MIPIPCQMSSTPPHHLSNLLCFVSPWEEEGIKTDRKWGRDPGFDSQPRILKRIGTCRHAFVLRSKLILFLFINLLYLYVLGIGGHG